MTNEDRQALVAQKLNKLREELEALGVESSFFYRAPGSAKAPVACLLVGMSAEDVEEARRDTRLWYEV